MDRKESGEGRMNQQKNPPRVAVVGTGSGCGKTTVVCALLQAFCNRGLKAASFKCGPDYIDPMFHREALGIAVFLWRRYGALSVLPSGS